MENITVQEYLQRIRIEAAGKEDWQTVTYVTQILEDGELATGRWRAFARIMRDKWHCPEFAPLGEFMRGRGLHIRNLLRFVITLALG